MTERRRDPLTGEEVILVAHRQTRPNLPAEGCPFCVGGLEAPEPYQVRAFPNRWPPLPRGRAEIVLYTSDHDATFSSLGVDGARAVIDLWADRTTALGAHDDVDYVLVFENRGPEVGATIAHPHGQIYALEAVPPAAARELRPDGDCPLCPPPDPALVVGRHDGWLVTVPWAATWPYGLLVAPEDHIADLPTLDDHGRRGLARALIDVLARLDGLFDEPMPLMVWVHQRPTDGGSWPGAHLHLHVAPLYRSPGTPRFVAAGELGSGVFFNPVRPEDAVAALRVGRGPVTVTAAATVRARAPGRVNLMGDHVDYLGGSVLPMAVQLTTTVEGRPGGDTVVLESTHEPEPVRVSLFVDDPTTVEPPWGRYVAGVVTELRPARGFAGRVTTDLPVGAGLSSSAALEVATALALGFDGAPEELALLAQRAEQRASGVPSGVMDQLVIAAAREGAALLIDCGSLDHHDVPVPGDLDIVVVHSGRSRNLARSGYATRRSEVEAALRSVDDDPAAGWLDRVDPAAVEAMPDPVGRRRARHAVSEHRRVAAFAEALVDDDRARMGRLMAESHASLRDDFQVSTEEVEALVGRLGARPGVWGVRLTGGGFGGCVVALCEPGALDEGWSVRPAAGASVRR